VEACHDLRNGQQPTPDRQAMWTCGKCEYEQGMDDYCGCGHQYRQANECPATPCCGLTPETCAYRTDRQANECSNGTHMKACPGDLPSCRLHGPIPENEGAGGGEAQSNPYFVDGEPSRAWDAGAAAATARIVAEVEAMVSDYPEDVWPEPTPIPTGAQAAHLMRRMLPIIADRIRRKSEHEEGA
jgi:hypothetical protein